MRITTLALLGVLGSACLSPSGEQAADDALGNVDHCFGDDDCGSPFHRPGQPCLVCHSTTHNSGEKIFALAGTVYLRATDERGLEAADVHVVDGNGNTVTVPTNSSGNFYIMDRRERLDIDREDGEAKVPFEVTFPVSIEVEYRGVTQVMRSLIWQDGSCARCHQASEGSASAGKIFLEEAL